MKEFGPSYKNGRQPRSTEKIESVRSAKKSKSTSRKQKDEKTRKIQKILEKFKGTNNINSIKSAKKRILIPKVKNKEGEAVKTRQGIANVFAKFYEELDVGEDETDNEDTTTNGETDQDEYMDEFTTEEIQSAIDRLKKKKGKAKDSNGIRAEQLKICSEETKEKIRVIFNEIAQQEDFTRKAGVESKFR